MHLPIASEPWPKAAAEPDAAVDQVIASYGGDARAAVRALVVAAGFGKVKALQQNVSADRGGLAWVRARPGAGTRGAA